MPSIRGKVTEALEARLSLRLIGVSVATEVECTLDTGFDGALVLPSNLIEQLGISPLSQMVFSMVGGTQVTADVALVEIEWLGEVLRVDAIIMEDWLIGTTLLAGTHLVIDYASRTLNIER